MGDEDDQETQGLANARETRDLVMTLALQLAGRVIEHVEAHEVAYVVLEEQADGGGFVWELKAAYGRGHSFVRVEGEPKSENPRVRAGIVASLPELTAVMGGQSASFVSNVPRAWIELALRAHRSSDQVLGVVEATHDDGTATVRLS